MSKDKLERLYARAMAIQEGRVVGHWLPIAKALANRGHGLGMLEFARWLKANGKSPQAQSLCLRAFRMGEINGAQHMAMDCFNANNLKGYRYWLARAAAKGDAQSKYELKRFETRMSHGAAFDIGRGRPNYPNEGYGKRRPV